MSLHDRATSLQSHVVKRVRKVTEAPARIWNDTSFAQFTTRDEAPVPRSASQIFPEAENLAGLNLQSIQLPRSQPQVLNFPGLQEKLRRKHRVPQGSSRFRQHHVSMPNRRPLQRYRRSSIPFRCPSLGPEASRPEMKPSGPRACWQLFIVHTMITLPTR
jgi:hypothetical protein